MNVVRTVQALSGLVFALMPSHRAVDVNTAMRTRDDNWQNHHAYVSNKGVMDSHSSSIQRNAVSFESSSTGDMDDQQIDISRAISTTCHSSRQSNSVELKSAGSQVALHGRYGRVLFRVFLALLAAGLLAAIVSCAAIYGPEQVKPRKDPPLPNGQAWRNVNQSFLSDDEEMAQIQQRYFAGAFTIISDLYSPALANPSSIEFQAKATDLEVRIRRIYSNSALAPYTQSVVIQQFSAASGSGIRVNFYVSFAITATRTVTLAEAKILFQQTLNNIKRMDSPLYQLDIPDTSFTIIDSEGGPPVTPVVVVPTAPATTTTSTIATTTKGLVTAPDPTKPHCSSELIPYCADMPYTTVRYPNVVGHTSAAEARAAVAFFQVLEILKCHPAVHNFTCYLLQPPCDETAVTVIEPLCRPFCEAVMETCGKYFTGTEYGKKFACRDHQWTINSTMCYQACAPDDYYCTETDFCIPKAKHCDQKFDCGTVDKTDEKDCSCNATSSYLCSNGVCVPKSRHCNNWNDCGKWEDEVNCTCTTGFKQCRTTGQCFPATSWCDYKFDCADNSDEEGCTCKPYDYKCQLGYCKKPEARCNGVNDCGDYSDELDCQCRPFELRCDTYLCKPLIRSWCNRRPDCDDGSDEPANCTCQAYQWQCKNGQCIPAYERCDAAFQCDDNSDEQNCTCSRYEFACGDGTCIPGRQICDGKPQCRATGNDEKANCTCKEEQFQCSDGLCVDIQYWCDESDDCANGEDERQDCKTNCPTTHPLRCTLVQGNQDGCLHRNRMCDGIRDCANGEDEQNCKCDSTTQFACKDRICKPWSMWCNGQKDCADGSDEPANCTCDKLQQLPCADGKCYAAKARCDGNSDCADFSDELNCTCGDVQLKKNPSLVCDHTYDCADFSDELKCSNCTSDSLICGAKCVPASKICDGWMDCKYGEDERNCLRLAGDEPTSNAKYWEFNERGYLYGRQGNVWYKVCADNFVNFSQPDLKSFGERICNQLMHYKTLVNISVQKDTQMSMYLTLLDHVNLQAIKVSASLCPTQNVLHISCRDMACGVRPLADLQIARIVGGDDARPGKWPWYAAIYKDGAQWCGSTIIHPHWVLTAAHCFNSEALLQNEPPRAGWDPSWVPKDPDQAPLEDFPLQAPPMRITVRAGVHRSSSEGPFDQFRLATHLVVHGNYDQISGYNDIALVRVDRPFRYSDYAMPGCLPEKFTPVPKNVKCYIVGLGGLGWMLRGADILQEVQIPVNDSDECSAVPSINWEHPIRNTQICAGYPEGGKDTCQGDSGGPLFCQDAQGRWTTYGVVSKGYKCAKAQTPGVYTKASMYIEWINNIINKPPAGEGYQPCNQSQFGCYMNQCLDKSVQCNGKWDCHFGEDELGCTYGLGPSRSTSAPQNMTPSTLSSSASGVTTTANGGGVTPPTTANGGGSATPPTTANGSSSVTPPTTVPGDTTTVTLPPPGTTTEEETEPPVLFHRDGNNKPRPQQIYPPPLLQGTR